MSHVDVSRTARAAVMFEDSIDCRVAHSVLWTNYYGVEIKSASALNTINHCTIADNSYYQIYLDDGSLSMNNSITYASGLTSYCIYHDGTSYSGDYNNLFTTNGARVGYRSGARVTLNDWQAVTGQDTHSLAHDPLFAVTAGDYHLQSSTGRYVRATGLWVRDSEHSPSIDTADPGGNITTLSRSRMGGVANQGAYGASWEASMSTNIWLTATQF